MALANTNHWLRGASYGWQAAEAGAIAICWTNTLPNLPPWGSSDPLLGNNPLVIAVPRVNGHVVLDMAMSQYSFGSMELSVMKNEMLPVYGGYNKLGELTKDPAAIIESWRPIPVGYWKGAGMSLLLDILTTVLSGGFAGYEITKSKIETNISQLFIAIDISKLSNHSLISKTVEGIIDDYHQSEKADASKKITYPGERVLQSRKRNLVNGIPVLKKVWDRIMEL